MSAPRPLPKPNQVFVARAPRADYGLCETGPWPELPATARPTVAVHTLRRLFEDAGFDRPRQGTSAWNPLADVIAPGAKVLLKPNWVLHEHRSGRELDSLVTHATLIEAVLHYAVRAQPGSLVVGDAPLQSCDFESLQTASGMGSIAQPFRADGVEWVHALLMGFAPQAIPLVRECFQLSTRPLVGFRPAAIQTWVDGVACPLEAGFEQHGRQFPSATRLAGAL